MVGSVNNFDFDILVVFSKIKDKFHGLVGPPAGIFEEKPYLQSQEEKF